MKTNQPTVKSTKTTTHIDVPNSPTPEVVTPATKPVKANPSASYIGFSISGTAPKTVNFRQGKKNIIQCNQVKCVGANATGRRLAVTFHDAEGKEILSRRVYKEYFEKMAQVFEVELPE